MYYQTLLDRCQRHISTDGMSHDDWLEKRRYAIGGSDAGALMGLNHYGSPLTVYLQKKNLVPKTEAGKAARRGSLLEPVIRAETAKDFPELEIEAVPFMFTDPDHPFMAANIDGLVCAKTPVEIRGQIVEGLGGFEAKSAKTYYGWKEDEIPDSYYCQVQHYMKVLGLDWFLVAAYILDDETISYYVIHRNEEFITRLVAAEKDFWENFIEKNLLPAATGIENEDDMITGMFNGSASTLNLTEEEQEICRRIDELKARIKPLEAEQEALKIDLKAKLVTRAKPSEKERKVSAIGGSYSVAWSFFESRRVDTDALKKAGLYDQYSKVSTSDRLTVSVKKEA